MQRRFSCDDIILNFVLFQVEAHHTRISKPLTDHFHWNKCFNIVSDPGIKIILEECRLQGVRKLAVNANVSG